MRHDIYRYEAPVQSRWGPLGKVTQQLADRPLARYVERIEQAYGHRVWLHPRDYYGTDTPELEAVIERPVAAASPSADLSRT